MLIPIVWGRAFVGEIDEVDGACVATLASHFMGLPVHAHGSFVVFPATSQGPSRTISLPLQRDSHRLGYLRRWGAPGLMFVMVSTMSISSAAPFGSAMAVGVVVPLLLAGLYLRCLRRTAPDRRGVLRAYGVSTGIPADPGRLGSLRERIEADVRRTLDERYGQADRDYREAAEPRSWAAVALDPAVTDLGLVARALTLTRLEASRADRSERQALDETHAELWRKLRRLDPSIVAVGSARRSSPYLVFVILGCLYFALGPLMFIMMRVADQREAARPRPPKPTTLAAPTPGGRRPTWNETIPPGTHVEVFVWGAWVAAEVVDASGAGVDVRLGGSGDFRNVPRSKVSIPPPAGADSLVADAGATIE
jgi:hypothetical protein